MAFHWLGAAAAAAARVAIRGLDALLRRIYGIHAFTDDPKCLFRVAFRRSPYDRTLSDGTRVRRGDPIVELHFWNERLPRMGPHGPDATWALRFAARLRHSLRLLAEYLATDPRARDVVAVYGYTYLTWDERDPQQLLLRRLGFTFFVHPPPRTPWGWVIRFFTQGYTWALVWTYNPTSLRARAFFRERLVEIWMSRQQLLAHLPRGIAAPAAAPLTVAASPTPVTPEEPTDGPA